MLSYERRNGRYIITTNSWVKLLMTTETSLLTIYIYIYIDRERAKDFMFYKDENAALKMEISQLKAAYVALSSHH